MFGSSTKIQKPCLEKVVHPQSYYLQEQSFSPSLCLSPSLHLIPFLTPKTLGESAASRPVAVNSLFVLLHSERGDGSFYIIDWKIYMSFGKKEEWVCGGPLVNSDLTKWKEKDSLHFLKYTHMHHSTCATRDLLYVHTPAWIHECCNTSKHTVMSHL